jgi:hypothetical protein
VPGPLDRGAEIAGFDTFLTHAKRHEASRWEDRLTSTRSSRLVSLSETSSQKKRPCSRSTATRSRTPASSPESVSVTPTD